MRNTVTWINLHICVVLQFHLQLARWFVKLKSLMFFVTVTAHTLSTLTWYPQHPCLDLHLAFSTSDACWLVRQFCRCDWMMFIISHWISSIFWHTGCVCWLQHFHLNGCTMHFVYLYSSLLCKSVFSSINIYWPSLWPQYGFYRSFWA